MRRRALAAALLALGGCGGAASATTSSPSGWSGYAPYLDVTAASGTFDLVGLARAAHAHEIVLAFVIAGHGCTPARGGSIPVAGGSLAPQIAAARRGGLRVAISFGGQAGPELARRCPSPGALAAAYESVLAHDTPDRLDFDIEGAEVGDRAAIARLGAALVALEATPAGRAVPVTLTLPASPGGLDPGAGGVLRRLRALGARIDAVNLLAMDWGGRRSPRAMLTLATGAAAGARRAIGAPIAVTVMAGVNDSPGETFTLADAGALAAWAQRSGTPLALWALGRDRACPRPTRAAVADCSGVAQSPWQFSRLLARG